MFSGSSKKGGSNFIIKVIFVAVFQKCLSVEFSMSACWFNQYHAVYFRNSTR